MTQIQLNLTEQQDTKLNLLKIIWKSHTKADVIKRLIDRIDNEAIVKAMVKLGGKTNGKENNL